MHKSKINPKMTTENNAKKEKTTRKNNNSKRKTIEMNTNNCQNDNRKQLFVVWK